MVSYGEAEKPDAIYEAGRLHDIEEAFFLFTLLMQDYNELRSVIIHTWNQYDMEIYGLVIAVLTTNTAMILPEAWRKKLNLY